MERSKWSCSIPEHTKLKKLIILFWKHSDPNFLYIGSLTFCQDAWKSIQFHWFITVQLYIIFAYCSWTRTILCHYFPSGFQQAKHHLFQQNIIMGCFSLQIHFPVDCIKNNNKKKTTQTQPKKQTNPPKPTHTHPHPPAVQLGCVAYPPIKKRLLCLPENSPSLQGDYWLLGRSPWGNERRRTKSVSVRMWVYALAHTRVRETKK